MHVDIRALSPIEYIYRDIKYIYFELCSDNIKINVENIIPNINSLNTCLKLKLDIFVPTEIHYFKVISYRDTIVPHMVLL